MEYLRVQDKASASRHISVREVSGRLIQVTIVKENDDDSADVMSAYLTHGAAISLGQRLMVLEDEDRLDESDTQVVAAHREALDRLGWRCWARAFGAETVTLWQELTYDERTVLSIGLEMLYFRLLETKQDRLSDEEAHRALSGQPAPGASWQEAFDAYLSLAAKIGVELPELLRTEGDS